MRAQQISVSLTAKQIANLDLYARGHHWSRSRAAAILISEALGGGTRPNPGPSQHHPMRRRGKPEG